MRKRLISVCIVAILVYSIYGCAQTAEDAPTEETENMETEYAETESEKEADASDVKSESDETAISEEEYSESEKLAEPIYIIQPQLTLNDTYKMQYWQAAYVEYLEGLDDKEHYYYSLIYVDDDDIPELVIFTNFEAGGCKILTFHDGEVDALQTNRLGFDYIERKNLINNSDGNMGYYYDKIYSIENGKWIYVTGGVWYEDYENRTEDYIGYLYEWEDQLVEEEVYQDKLDEIFDGKQAKEPEQYERLDEMLFRLQMGTALSQTHRYELYIEDITWDEAKRQCEEKGGYLAAITTIEEYEHIKKGIEDSGQTQIAYWVGASDDYPSSYYSIYEWREPNRDYLKDIFINYTVMKRYWAEGEPSYYSHIADEKFDELGIYLLYDDVKENCYLYDAPPDMLLRNPEYAGKIGYICEYDSPDVQKQLLSNVFKPHKMQDWQEAYVEYAEELEAEYQDKGWSDITYSLIYVDEDDIPELVIDAGFSVYHILTFHDGAIDELKTDRATARYMERQNLLDDDNGAMGFYHDYIYSIENGKWVYVTGGEIFERHDDSNREYFDFRWEGEEVTEAVYEQKLKEVFDTEYAIEPENFVSFEEMLSLFQM